MRESQHRYYLKNKYVIAVHRSASRLNYHLRNRHDVLQFLGGKCVICGYDADERALQIDHINGGSKADIERFSSYVAYLKHVREVNGKGYQVLCANCNAIKRMERRECRKKVQEQLL